MMATRIALCIDGETYRDPSLMGLGGESLDGQEWLAVFESGAHAREAIAGDSALTEAWVVSCSDVEPINLAATLKSDRPDLCVRLVGFDGCGSLYSRAYNASIDEVMDRTAFIRRYSDEKMAALSALPGGAHAAAGGESAANRAPAPATPMEAPQGSPGDIRLMEPVAVEQLPVQAPVQAPVLARSRGFVMPVVSGSGGAGKSSVAVASAFIASRLGYRVLLLDYDLQFGDAAILAGREDALTVDVALSHPEQLEQELRKNNNPTIIAAPKRLEDAERASHDAPRLIEELSGAFDLIVANTGAAWADHHAALLERSSAALFLVDQRASSLRACRHALELCARCGIATGPFQFALNRCKRGSALSSVDVSCALQGVPVHEIEDGGLDVEDYLGAGAADDLVETGNPFCASLERLLTKLLPGAGLLSVERMEPIPERRFSKKRARHAGRRRGWSL